MLVRCFPALDELHLSRTETVQDDRCMLGRNPVLIAADNLVAAVESEEGEQRRTITPQRSHLPSAPTPFRCCARSCGTTRTFSRTDGACADGVSNTPVGAHPLQDLRELKHVCVRVNLTDPRSEVAETTRMLTPVDL